MKECNHDWEITQYYTREFGIMVDSKCTKCEATRYMCVDADKTSAHWVDWVVNE